MIEAGQRYDAIVLAAKPTEAKDGKPAVWVNFQLLDGAGVALGALSKTVWLTPANRDQARKSLRALGATEAQVTSKVAFADLFANLDKYLGKAECAVTTEETEYQGKKRIEIKWINSRIKPASDAAIERASALFDGVGAAANSDEHYGEEY